MPPRSACSQETLPVEYKQADLGSEGMGEEKAGGEEMAILETYSNGTEQKIFWCIFLFGFTNLSLNMNGKC